MKIATFACLSILAFTSCTGQEKTSAKKFNDITMVNKIETVDPAFDQPRFSCAFLLQYQNQTFAVTAKHLLQVMKIPAIKNLVFEGAIKNWLMYPLDKKDGVVITGKLLNESASESLDNKASYDNDWLLFSIKENHSQIKPLQPRTSPLVPGEKLYVVGWTRKMEDGAQRVYEFEYYKTIGHRILLKELVVPEQFGCLSGAPLVDEDGKVVGLASNGTVDPVTGKKFFSPCVLDNLLVLIDNHKSNF